ncbi:aspartyl protease family protein [Phenylobacterium sp.]|jgi:predicted aspartyl protease|uniref:aspartyl protease family protein n=1 Tax=Phenylobacterium sp. TaxID=1871053 RepID=UPI002F41ED57
MKTVSIAALATAALLAPLQAQAACKLATAEVPVTMQGLRPLVSVKISGKPVKLVLDSGAFASFLTGGFAAQAKLQPYTAPKMGSLVPSAANTVTSGVRGDQELTGIVIAPTFEVGGSTFPNVKFLTTGANVGADAVGLIGQNLLHTADDEYDFKNGVLRLVQPQGCETTELAYWVKPGMTYSMVPLETEGHYNGHTIAEITVNGEKLRAWFDTGADTSFITAHAAAKVGVHTTDTGVKRAGDSHGLDGAVKTWVATFASVKIGDEEIKNAKLAIGESNAEDFDVLIGADFFLAHHVYVANSQKKLYFSYDGGPVFRSAAPAETASSGDGKGR